MNRLLLHRLHVDAAACFLDIKTKCIETCTTQKQIAQEIGTSLPYVNRVIRSKENVVNKTFLKIMDTKLPITIQESIG